MTRHENMSDTKRLMGLLPLYVGMEVRLTERILAPSDKDPVGVVPDCLGTVVEIILHPSEGNILERATAKTEGFVILNKLPRAVLVKLKKSTVNFLPADANGVQRPGVIAITPSKKTWKFKDAEQRAAPGQQAHTIQVDRYQLALAPSLPRTLHTFQGMTAEPGMIAHWVLPRNLPEDEQWLATYVMLSRPRSLATLLSHGLPRRDLLERGPPEGLQKEMEELLLSKIPSTRDACKEARKNLNWPANPNNG